METQIERITRMEQALNSCTDAVEALCAALDRYDAVQEQLAALADYYSNGEWSRDHDDDAEGRLPADLPRGVLCEDSIYDLLGDQQALLERMQELISKRA
jgi:hypothetical protein